MTVPKNAKDAIRRAGGGAETGQGAPNGLNPMGAMNIIERIAQVIEDNGYADYTDLDADRQQEYEDAWEDFQYWGKLMANVFTKDVVAGDGDIEVDVETGTDEDGNPIVETKTYTNPHGASAVDNDSADLPDRP